MLFVRAESDLIKKYETKAGCLIGGLLFDLLLYNEAVVVKPLDAAGGIAGKRFAVPAIKIGILVLLHGLDRFYHGAFFSG